MMKLKQLTKKCKVCKARYKVPTLFGAPLWQGYVDGYCSIDCKQRSSKGGAK